jgi:V8-like Glu-specific endopeptidase
MAGKTVKPYKATLSGSIGAGIGSVFNPRGRKYYILEHKVSSKYHRAGEAQEIIVDQIEIGRDSRCQVRFDDNFSTVSRRHAAIIKDGDNWKLVQISKTNTTLLNGRPVQNEWYLQNGDEIQLSVNGPKLGFIVPTGKKATVGSIGLTRRLSLFRQQALRPYKQAIAVLATVLILAVGGLSTWNIFLRNDLVKQSKVLAQEIEANKDNKAKADSLAKKLVENNKKMKDYEKRMGDMAKETTAAQNQARSARIAAANAMKAVTRDSEVGDNELEKQCFPYTYAIYQVKEVITQPNGEVQTNSDVHLVGTGFLLSDGRFVTARHVTETWYYCQFNWGDERINQLLRYQNAVVHNGGNIESTFIAISSKGDRITFTNKQCRVNRSSDKVTSMQLNDGTSVVIKLAVASTTDWATVNVSKKGIGFDSALSAELPAGTKLKILGFPYGRGGENPTAVSPISSSAEVARKGLDTDGTIMASNNDTQSGNSGGPVFVIKEGKYIAVGVLSGDTRGKGRIVPLKYVR